MDPLLSFGHVRRPVAERVLLIYRTRPEVTAELLPDRFGDARPRLFAGHGLVLVAYTRLARPEPRWLRPSVPGRTHHLTYHLPVDFGPREGERPGSVVLRRESSAWFAARWAARLSRAERIRSRFRVEEDGLDFRLHVRRPDAEDLRLRASHAMDWPPGLFRSARELTEFLASTVEVRPPDAFQPAADQLADAQLAPEPLEVHACEGALPFPALAGERATLDAAVRLHRRVLTPIAERVRLPKAVPGDASSAAPAI